MSNMMMWTYELFRIYAMHDFFLSNNYLRPIHESSPINKAQSDMTAAYKNKKITQNLWCHPVLVQSRMPVVCGSSDMDMFQIFSFISWGSVYQGLHPLYHVWSLLILFPNLATSSFLFCFSRESLKKLKEDLSQLINSWHFHPWWVSSEMNSMLQHHFY